MTEASPVITANYMEAPRICLIGMPISSTNVRIADKQDNELEHGEIGEI